MKIQRIAALLSEATTATDERANAILVELCDATHAARSGVYETDTPAGGVLALIVALFGMYRDRGDADLLDLLPVFLLACGERHNNNYLYTVYRDSWQKG